MSSHPLSYKTVRFGIFPVPQARVIVNVKHCYPSTTDQRCGTGVLAMGAAAARARRNPLHAQTQPPTAASP